jgi:hypothetical protein
MFAHSQIQLCTLTLTVINLTLYASCIILQPDVSAYTGIYQMRCTAYKVAPDDGLTESETCRASNGK